LEKRENVLYSEIMQVEPPGDGKLSGFYVTPVGRYGDPFSFAERLLPRFRGVEFLPRPEEDQYLRPWTPEELQRLGLPPEDERETVRLSDLTL
jgi:hypothetical protein